MTFASYARSLEADLMVGSGILSFSPGQIGYAAVGSPTEGGCTDSGTDSDTIERRRGRPSVGAIEASRIRQDRAPAVNVDRPV
jgi:hypothetical protein